MDNNTFLICICICVVILLYLLPKSRTYSRFYKNYSFKENKRAIAVGSSVELRKSENYYKRYYIQTNGFGLPYASIIYCIVFVYTQLYIPLERIENMPYSLTLTPISCIVCI